MKKLILFLFIPLCQATYITEFNYKSIWNQGYTYISQDAIEEVFKIATDEITIGYEDIFERDASPPHLFFIINKKEKNDKNWTLEHHLQLISMKFDKATVFVEDAKQNALRLLRYELKDGVITYNESLEFILNHVSKQYLVKYSKHELVKNLKQWMHFSEKLNEKLKPFYWGSFKDVLGDYIEEKEVEHTSYGLKVWFDKIDFESHQNHKTTSHHYQKRFFNSEL